MELSEGEKIIQEAIRRKKEDEKRERKCNQELKKWDEVYKEIVSRYENVKESQETLTFQEYCLKQWMRKNGVELKICKITDAKVQNYLDGELESCMEKITYCLETIDYDMAHDMKKEVIRQLKRYEKKNE